MSKQIIEGFVFYDTDPISEMCYGTRYRFFPGSGSAFATYIPVVAHTLEVDIPTGFDPRPIEIKALEEKRAEVMAEAEAKVTAINARISKLQAITYDSEPA